MIDTTDWKTSAQLANLLARDLPGQAWALDAEPLPGAAMLTRGSLWLWVRLDLPLEDGRRFLKVQLYGMNTGGQSHEWTIPAVTDGIAQVVKAVYLVRDWLTDERQQQVLAQIRPDPGRPSDTQTPGPPTLTKPLLVWRDVDGWYAACRACGVPDWAALALTGPVQDVVPALRAASDHDVEQHAGTMDRMTLPLVIRSIVPAPLLALATTAGAAGWETTVLYGGNTDASTPGYRITLMARARHTDTGPALFVGRWTHIPSGQNTPPRLDFLAFDQFSPGHETVFLSDPDTMREFLAAHPALP